MTLLSNIMFDFYTIFLLICPWLCFIVFSYYNETLFLLSTSIYWIFFVLEWFVLKTLQSVFAFFIVFHIFFFLQERNLWWGIFCCLSSFISLSLFPIIRSFFSAFGLSSWFRSIRRLTREQSFSVKQAKFLISGRYCCCCQAWKRIQVSLHFTCSLWRNLKSMIGRKV